ncbi:MAG: helix-turn-helix transcriptional regulator [Bacteroidota bacterium]
MAQSKLGKRISELRASKGLTQQELADSCNLNVRTIQRIEAGEVAPRMYTLNLLAKPLEMDLNTLNQDSAETKKLSKKIKLAFIAGAVFSINGIPIIYDLITHGLNSIMHLLTSIIHILSCIAFFSGFYYIGSFYKNWILAISALIMAILLPAINILDLIKHYYFSIGEFLLFILMSINMIIIGVGLLKESLERKGCENSRTYKIAGISIILTSVFYLTLNTKIINAGLILSLPANLVLVYILYKEMRLSRENRGVQSAMG